MNRFDPYREHRSPIQLLLAVRPDPCHPPAVSCTRPLCLASRWLLLLLICTGGLIADDGPPSYAEWRAACAKLPPNRVLNGRLPARSLLPLRGLAEFHRVFDAHFALVTNGPLADPGRW